MIIFELLAKKKYFSILNVDDDNIEEERPLEEIATKLIEEFPEHKYIKALKETRENIKKNSKIAGAIMKSLAKESFPIQKHIVTERLLSCLGGGDILVLKTKNGEKTFKYTTTLDQVISQDTSVDTAIFVIVKAIVALSENSKYNQLYTLSKDITTVENLNDKLHNIILMSSNKEITNILIYSIMGNSSIGVEIENIRQLVEDK